MSIYKKLIIVLILMAFVFTDMALSCPDGMPPTIISPNDNEVYLAGGTFTNLCKATGDAVITWSGGGEFSPTTGSPVSWTAPSTTGYVTIIATNSYGSDQVKVRTADIIYVDEDAEGENDGTSWEDAFLDLQDGLGAASSGNHIWVAEGEYKPGTTVYHTFLLVDGVEIYGGFDPTVGDRDWAERDFINNVTILSGDIDGDDTLNNTNSHHVVTCTDPDIDGSTRLDGFTITMGFADYWLCDGAGMKIENCDPNVANCIFKENRAYGNDGDGGGMGCYNSSPEVTNCIFIDNIAGDDGGALVNTYGSNGTFTNCVFYSNNTNGENLEYEDGQWKGKSNGGAIWNTASEKTVPIGSSPTFINCLIAGNSTVPGQYGGKNGGGVANKGEGTDPVFINCTFTENTAYTDGGGMCTKDDAEATVINCIFWDNKALDDDDSIRDKNGGVTNVSYSDVNQPGYAPDDNNISQDPNFANPGDPDGPDDRFLTCDDGYRICFDSNCVDAADCTATNAPATDILDFNRVDIRAVTNTGEGPRYSDMGAYEAVVDYAIFISVDGCGSYSTYLPPLISGGHVPNMKDHFIDDGMWTTNARSDYWYTKTLPGHTTMITGRPVLKGSLDSDDIHHGYIYNTYPGASDTLHNKGNTGDPPTGYMYKASPFDIVHEHEGDLTTALYANKDKFVIFWQSYNSTGGRDGDQKIDHYKMDPSTSDETDPNILFGYFEARGMDNFVFFHFRGPDSAGHDRSGDGWGGAEWDAAVKVVDDYLLKIFEMVKDSSNKEKPWYYNTAVIMTADHGGKDYGHGDNPGDLEECQLPFGVWGHLVPKKVDAYDYCDLSRTNPGSERGNDCNNDYTGQPIRHADGVDLALSLMGMPEIDGSLINGMKLKLP